MKRIWDARTYDAARRRLVPCFDQFYGAAVEFVAQTAPANPRQPTHEFWTWAPARAC